MKLLKNKFAAIVLAIFFILLMTASVTLLPSASAHTPPWKLPTYAYIWASPNPVGVNQTVSVYMWLTNFYYGSAVGNTLTFNGYNFTIIAPNGAVKTTIFNDINPTSN